MYMYMHQKIYVPKDIHSHKQTYPSIDESTISSWQRRAIAISDVTHAGPYFDTKYSSWNIRIYWENEPFTERVLVNTVETT